MPDFTQDDVIRQLRTVDDPELHKDLVTLNMVKSVEIDGATVRLQIELTTPACPMKDKIAGDVKQAVMRLPGVDAVELQWSAQVRSGRMDSPVLEGVKNVIAEARR